VALLGLVADLYRSKELRKEFNEDPERVITKYELSPDEKKVLYTMRVQDIGDTVRQEIIDVNFDFIKGEFKRVDEMFMGELDETATEYPAPTPQVFRFRPKKAPAAGGKFELNVYGQSFSRDAQIKLKKKTGGGPDLVVKGHRVFGTFRCSQARGVVTPGAAGIYTVQIQNSPNAAGPPTPIDGGDFELT
jgi:hypothetical protein